MKLSRLGSWPLWSLMGCGLLCAISTGCQTVVGGGTLPSAYYLKDDIQYFRHGPEFKLSNQVQALEQYKIEQQAVRDGLAN